MIQRILYPIAFPKQWDRQMRFITGPRQSGKTTLSLAKLSNEASQSLYYLWDLRSVRNSYKKNQLFFTEDSPPRRQKQWVCFDEMHKIPKLNYWKDATGKHYSLFDIRNKQKQETDSFIIYQ